MSAFMVSSDHIDGILSYARQRDAYLYPHGRAKEADLTLVGRILLNENARSVNTRYGSDSGVELDDILGYEFKPFKRSVTELEVLKACDCFDYQACETSDYDASPAADLIRRIRAKAICELAGYNQANGWELKR